MHEKEIAENIISGDEEAFRRLVNTYQKTVLNICYQFVHNRETAEDLTQEVFILVYSNMSFYRGESSLKTWISRIAVTRSLDHLKAVKRKKRIFWFQNKFTLPLSGRAVPSADEHNPGYNVEREERLRILDEALSKLPEKQKIAFLLSHHEDMSGREIGEIMNLSLASVESLIYRAKKNLKKILFNHYNNNL